jgi:glutamyl-tRNA reductase
MRSPLDHSALRVLGARAGTVAPSAADVRAWPGVAEAVVLATCHRTEIYVVADDIALGRRGVSASDVPAAHHLLRVACGLESPILGDGQILGQVRRAYLTARQAGATGPWLNRLFEAALHAGKRVRHHTDLGRGATTTAAAAVGVAERLAGGMAGRHVLIVGAGETAALAARHAAHRRPAQLVIANRTRTRAEAVAAKVQGVAIGLDDLRAALAEADVVISATSAPGAVIHAAPLGALMTARGGRPLVALDLAVPGDIEPACGAIDGVTRVALERVEAEAATDRITRAAAVPAAEAIASEALRAFCAWSKRRAAFVSAA